MIYSCFNEKLGQYEYFHDDRGHALNGDLPVPSYLGGKTAGKIGVPAREAGRPMPSGAKKIGQGFEAKGMIVSCKVTPMRGLSGGDDAERFKMMSRFALVTVGAGVGFAVGSESDYFGHSPARGALGGASLGLLVAMLAGVW